MHAPCRQVITIASAGDELLAINESPARAFGDRPGDVHRTIMRCKLYLLHLTWTLVLLLTFIAMAVATEGTHKQGLRACQVRKKGMPLRAYDTVPLAFAGIVNQSLIAHGLPPLIFVTADDRLITATQGRESVCWHRDHVNGMLNW